MGIWHRVSFSECLLILHGNVQSKVLVTILNTCLGCITKQMTSSHNLSDTHTTPTCTCAVSVPPGMVQDQFGMMGLLTFIRGAETDPNLVALALGRYFMAPCSRKWHVCVWSGGEGRDGEPLPLFCALPVCTSHIQMCLWNESVLLWWYSQPSSQWYT